MTTSSKILGTLPQIGEAIAITWGGDHKLNQWIEGVVSRYGTVTGEYVREDTFKIGGEWQFVLVFEKIVLGVAGGYDVEGKRGKISHVAKIKNMAAKNGKWRLDNENKLRSTSGLIINPIPDEVKSMKQLIEFIKKDDGIEDGSRFDTDGDQHAKDSVKPAVKSRTRAQADAMYEWMQDFSEDGPCEIRRAASYQRVTGPVTKETWPGGAPVAKNFRPTRDPETLEFDLLEDDPVIIFKNDPKVAYAVNPFKLWIKLKTDDLNLKPLEEGNTADKINAVLDKGYDWSWAPAGLEDKVSARLEGFDRVRSGLWEFTPPSGASIDVPAVMLFASKSSWSKEFTVDSKKESESSSTYELRSRSAGDGSHWQIKLTVTPKKISYEVTRDGGGANDPSYLISRAVQRSIVKPNDLSTPLEISQIKEGDLVEVRLMDGKMVPGHVAQIEWPTIFVRSNLGQTLKVISNNIRKLKDDPTGQTERAEALHDAIESSYKSLFEDENSLVAWQISISSKTRAVVVSWDLTYKRDTPRGAFTFYRRDVDKANAILSEMVRKFGPQAVGYDLRLCDERGLRELEAYREQDGEELYSEYEQSLGGQVTFNP